jgi:hypothetical protein
MILKREKRTYNPMSPEQQRVLLHKHLTGDFPGQRSQTVFWLIRHGYLVRDDDNPSDSASGRGRITVTQKGKDYCDLHHLTMPSGKCA